MEPRRARLKKPPTASESSSSVMLKRCVPAPTKAAKRLSAGGARNTSACTSFQPVSSSPTSSSSSERM